MIMLTYAHIRFLHQLEAAVHGLITAYAQHQGIAPAEADEFFVRLRSNALNTALGEGGKDELLRLA